MIRQFFIMLLYSCACFFKVQAQDYYITTIAGIDTFGYAGDGGPAIDCELWMPESIRLDGSDNLYIADLVNERVRKINLFTGIINTVAGNGTPGYNGDNIPATNAELKAPVDVFTDMAGNVYIADGYNNRIRKITISTGIITTIAGNGTIGSSGDGGLATNAALNAASGVCVDKYNNIYIADYYNNKIRKVNAVTHIISTLAGTGLQGYSGDNGPATNAEFNWPACVALDTSGNLLISDQWNHAVRKLDMITGIITTIAGTGIAGYSGDGGLAIHAQLSQPQGLFVDKLGDVLIAEYGNGVIRRIDALTGIITTVAGNGIPGFSGDGGPATSAELWPDDAVLDSNGIMYIADYQNNRIRILYNPLGLNPLSSKNEIAIYPNPTRDELTIENAAGSILEIYDLLGKSVFQSLLTANTELVNISSLSIGVYVAVFIDKNGYRITKKVVKE